MEGSESGGKWAQNIALYAIAIVAIVLFIVWINHKSGQDKADLAASVQKLYGQMECIAPQLNKYADRVDMISNLLAKTSQSQADFQAWATSMITDIDGVVYAPTCGHNRGCGCGGTDKFVKSTEYTAGATTLVETDTCRS